MFDLGIAEQAHPARLRADWRSPARREAQDQDE
jgi:hypothetical protein